MALPRRFYALFVFSAFAVISAYFFLNRNNLPISISRPLPESWRTTFTTEDGGVVAANPLGDNYPTNEYDENGFVKVPPTAGTVPKTSQNKEPSNVESHDQELSSPSLIPTSPTQTYDPSAPSKAAAQEHEELRISIVESGGSHDEVTAALVHAFGSQKNSAVSLYLLLQRYGIGDIISKFSLSSPIAANKSSFDFANAVKESAPPQILVSATCELDLVRLAEPFETLLANGKTYMFCVVHHADRWAEGELVDKVRPWVEKQMVDFVTLSTHTARYLRTEAIAKWEHNATVTVQSLPPVFPVDIPDPPESFQSESKLSLTMQGDYDTSRRNYTSIFQRLGSVVEKAKSMVQGNETISHDVSLHILGHGTPPEVPKEVQQHTVFDEGLSYHDYYTLLSRSFALLPAFATEEYLDRKASSSIPAALIGGAPLVASQELLTAYSYLPRDAAWFLYSGESEMDVVQRVVGNADEQAQKRELVKATCKRLVQRNVELVDEWVAQGLKRADRANWKMAKM